MIVLLPLTSLLLLGTAASVAIVPIPLQPLLVMLIQIRLGL